MSTTMIPPFNRLILSIVFTFILHLFVVYLPAMQEIFGTVSLELGDWLIIFSMSITVLIGEELRKFFFRETEASDTKPVFLN